MSEQTQKQSSGRTVGMVLGVLAAPALFCCGGSALVVRFATPNVWKLMTMSADDFAVPDGGSE